MAAAPGPPVLILGGGLMGLALAHQLVANPVHLATLVEMEREVGACCAVIRAEQGDALARLGPLHVAPIGGIPSEPQPQPQRAASRQCPTR